MHYAQFLDSCLAVVTVHDKDVHFGAKAPPSLFFFIFCRSSDIAAAVRTLLQRYDVIRTESQTYDLPDDKPRF